MRRSLDVPPVAGHFAAAARVPSCRGTAEPDEETGPVRMRGLPPLDERRATVLEYVAVALTIAVIVALAVWFLGGEIVAGAAGLLG